MVSYTIRQARHSDVDRLLSFTLDEARESEGTELDPAAARRGVLGAFDDPPRAEYWVAESPGGEVVASTSLVTEWSNFRGGYYWWIQSLFIVPEHRGRGLVERLLDHLVAEARSRRALGLRLHAHQSNERALRVYRRRGFTALPYVAMSRPVE